ncbi:GGDEF domain-containing protein [Lysobacter koreensis]|uniref:diguanylate cyclase n=1 Tax=Lysobacter koreensis TaxID=266122 RepID=A0ABW2YR76_9GAMM
MATPRTHEAMIQARGLPRGNGGLQGDGAMTGILAQVSREALQGEGLDAVLQRIVDCLFRRLPVAIASIILLDDAGTHFVQEVWAGQLDLEQSVPLPWPVTLGAAGRCARNGQAQLIADIEHDPDYVPGHRAVRSEYLVPIRHRARMHGVLNIESEHAEFFTLEVRALFDAVADQIAGAIHLARVAGELAAANRKLEGLSMSDGLTGIANRRCFDLRLAADWQRLAQEGRMLALALVDADCFKPLNDTCGHLYGDECLRTLARLCGGFAERDEDLVARYGGEELVLLLPGRDLPAVHRTGEHLRQRVEAEAIAHPCSTVAPHVTISVGVCAMQPEPARAPELLIQTADRALYAAKAQGRNCVVAAVPRTPRDRRSRARTAE